MARRGEVWTAAPPEVGLALPNQLYHYIFPGGLGRVAHSSGACVRRHEGSSKELKERTAAAHRRHSALGQRGSINKLQGNPAASIMRARRRPQRAFAHGRARVRGLDRGPPCRCIRKKPGREAGYLYSSVLCVRVQIKALKPAARRTRAPSSRYAPPFLPPNSDPLGSWLSRASPLP